MTIESYRDLDAWQVGMAFAERVYQLTAHFPQGERFGLTSQVRRAATGIPSNISEGHQQTRRAYAHYIRLALGCQAEAQTQLELASRLGFADSNAIAAVMEQGDRLGRILHGLSRSLNRE